MIALENGPGSGPGRPGQISGRTHVFPLKEAAEAHRAISGRHTTGKVVQIT
jgi:NADPH:quinone reductase-like Zn-dependent oxidoreductase